MALSQEVLDDAFLVTNLKFNGFKNTEDLVDAVHDTLGNFNVKVNSVEGTVERFKASVRANIKDINEVQKFIKDYSENNNETLKVATSR